MIFPVTILGGLLILIGGRTWRVQVKGKMGEMRVRASLARIGVKVLNDIVLQGRNGLTQIDHVALTRSGLVVIETKNYGGNLYDQGRGRPWRQQFGSIQNTLHNPLDQNYGHLRAAMEATGLGRGDVLDVVVLAGEGRFPKGAPQGVIALKNLRGWIRDKGGSRDIPVRYEQAWTQLKASVRDSKEDRAAQLHKVTGGGYKYWMETNGGWIAAAGFGFFVAGVFPW